MEIKTVFYIVTIFLMSMKITTITAKMGLSAGISREYEAYEEQEPNQLVVDYLASVTDDYFIELYKHIYPKGKHEVRYTGYFD